MKVDEPWTVVVLLCPGGYCVIGTFASRDAAARLAAESPDKRTVLFRPIWREQARSRADDF